MMIHNSVVMSNSKMPMHELLNFCRNTVEMKVSIRLCADEKYRNLETHCCLSITVLCTRRPNGVCRVSAGV